MLPTLKAFTYSRHSVTSTALNHVSYLDQESEAQRSVSSSESRTGQPHSEEGIHGYGSIGGIVKRGA